MYRFVNEYKHVTNMPVLKIPSLNITRDLRDKLLKTKSIESYSNEYVMFVVRTALSNILESVTLTSAVWNEKQNFWEGNMSHLGENHRWVITE